MKELFISILLAIPALLLTMTSCDNEEEEPIYRDIFMTVEVVDENGKNLIEDEAFIRQTTIEYNGTEYIILGNEIISRSNDGHWTPGIVNVRKKDGCMTTAIYMGEWDSSRLWENESVIITWPNGKCDTLSFSLTKPGYGHAEYFINGKKNDDSHFEIIQETKPLLKSVKAEQHEMTFEYDPNGQVSAFTSWNLNDYMEEKHNAQYSYDEKNHTIHIYDLWTRKYLNDKVLNPTPDITADLTVYVNPLYQRVDSIIEFNSTIHDERNAFKRYFTYDASNHLVNIKNSWQKEQTKIEWVGDDIVSGEDCYSTITFIPSNTSHTCIPNDSRSYFLSILDRPLLMAGLFGKAPKHLLSSSTEDDYKTEFKYILESSNIATVNIATSRNGKPYGNTTETYVWESPTSK